MNRAITRLDQLRINVLHREKRIFGEQEVQNFCNDIDEIISWIKEQDVTEQELTEQELTKQDLTEEDLLVEKVYEMFHEGGEQFQKVNPSTLHKIYSKMKELGDYWNELCQKNSRIAKISDQRARSKSKINSHIKVPDQRAGSNNSI